MPQKCIFSIFIAIFFAGSAKAQLTLDVESGLAFQDYNEVRIPNEAGTFFDFNRDFTLQGPVIPFRLQLGYTFSDKNHISLLYIPLSIRYQGNAPYAINFEGSVFAEDIFTEGFYKFNSYRLRYRRDLVRSNKWILGLGFTAKIRDASVRLNNETGVSATKDNVGFVPLLHLYAAYRLPGFSLYFEGDGLAGGPGRAFDLFLGGRIPIYKKLSAKAGYRFLEGGADVDDVYNFTLVQYAIIGLIYEF